MNDPQVTPGDSHANGQDDGLYCPRCGYDVRGSSGDVIRCPECGLENERGALEHTPANVDRRVRECRVALDTCSFGAVFLASGIVLALLQSKFALLSGLAGVLAIAVAIWGIRGRCIPRSGWLSATLAYVSSTFAFVLLVPLTWAAGSGVSWLILSPWVATADYWVVHLLVGGGLCLLTIGLWNPFPSLRLRQRDAFIRLVKYLR